jgi:serine protease Do
MFRMMLRSEGQVEAITNLDEAFSLSDDVHTNIIAGLAMDDGQTIVAWLPEAEAEFGPVVLPPPAARGLGARPSVIAIPTNRTKWRSSFPFRGGMFGSPDLTVIASDGKRYDATYVGLDAATGLSIMRLADETLPLTDAAESEKINVGQSIRVFGPERARKTPAFARNGVYVRMGARNGTVLSVKKAPAGEGVARFTVRSPHLSVANIGGVAVNEAGETIGIVDAIDGSQASILPTGLVRRAVKRVLDQQASVPRAWLGVKGEAVSQLDIDHFRNLGWKRERATSLVEHHRGILLTSIAADSPAALASLRAGDVILKVNNAFVENADDFSWMLDQAGPSTSVTFTLVRPDRMSEEAVNVELSGLLDTSIGFNFPNSFHAPYLLSQGIETVALKPAVASKLGATSGLLVVYVDPAGPGFEAGLQPGDVIQTIDGKTLWANGMSNFANLTQDSTSTFEIIRMKKKLDVVVKVRQEK